MRNCLLSLILFSLSVNCFSQSIPAAPIIATPNAAGLGQYGETPVSHYTGLPGIDVPIYTIEERGFKFPINLSYYAQGFRPDVHPSWVGLNWNLRFGGVITRRVNYVPDEWKSDDMHSYGYLYSYFRLNNPNWSSSDTLNQFANHSDLMQNDKQPDVFEFSLPNLSGKFFLDHTGKWRVQCSRNVRVILDQADIINPFFNNDISAYFAPKAIHKFTLIDDTGVKYIFGSSSAATAAVEYSCSMTPPKYEYRHWLIATSWYLQKIELPDNVGYININYVRGPFQSNFQYYESQNRFYAGNCVVGAPSSGNFESKGLAGYITSPVYPTDISTSSGLFIEFKFSKSNELSYPSSTYMEPLRDGVTNDLPSGSLDPQYFAFLNSYYHIPYYSANSIFPNGVNNTCFIWFKLDNIIISATDITNASVKVPFQRVKFNYRELTTERLKLTSIDFLGNVLSTPDPQTYSFNYTSFSTMDYVSNVTDHWGFANNKFLIKNGNGWYYWITGNVYDSRQPNEAFATYEMLSRIFYPTGGRSEFEYELNEYGRYLLDNRQFTPTTATSKAGGLRIKKINNVDNVGGVTTKEYFYVIGYNNSSPLSNFPSSGTLDRMPRYNFSVTTPVSTLALYSSNSIVPMSSNSGQVCTYSEVVEKYQDGSYRIMKFTNHDNGYTDNVPVNNITAQEMGVPVRARDFERGHLLSEQLVSAANTVVQKTEYTYLRIGAAADSNFARSFKKDFGGFCLTIAQNPYYAYHVLSTQAYQIPLYNGAIIFPTTYQPAYTIATAYGYYSYKFLKETEKQTTYSLDNPANAAVVEEKLYQYDQWGNIIKTTETNSKLGSVYRNFKYPYHYTGTTVYDAMMSKDMRGIVIESDKYEATTFVESEKTEYALFNSATLIKPQYIYKKIGSGASYIASQFNAYDANGNVKEMQGADGIVTSYLWSHLNSRSVAKIVGSNYASVQALINNSIIATPSNEAQLETEINKPRTLSNVFVSTYLYSPANGLSIKKSKDQNERNIYYEYDHLSRLTVVKDDDLNVLQKNEYKYSQSVSYPFRNTEQSKIIHPTTVTCPSGYAFNDVQYVVKQDKYGSFYNVTDANVKANKEIDDYGLAYANANAICYPFWTYVPCCLWGSPYSNFSLTGTGSVDFSLVVFKQSGTTNWSIDNQIANLSGSLFIPSVQRTVVVNSSGRTWEVTFKTSGQVSMRLISGTAPSGSTSIQLAGTYSL